MIQTRLRLVLVNTLYSSNIGSCARACANMGADQLILVAPKCEVNSKAKQGAAGAQEFLANRICYSDWSEFYAKAEDGYRIGLTRRAGKQRKLYELTQLLADPQLIPRITGPVYLILGPEDNGLSADDLENVHATACLPTYGEFQSLNLAQAALLSLFIARQSMNKEIESTPAPRGIEAGAKYYFPEESIRKWIESIGFDIEARQGSAYTTLKRLFLQNYPTAHEIHVLESVLGQTIRRLESLNLASEKITHDL